MTISSTSNRKEYTGDGATVAFATSPVVFFAEGDLTVYKVTTATGVATLQTITTDYTVAGGAGSTGTVTMLTAPASTETLVIVRELDLVQEVDFVNNEATDAEVAEDALDKLTMMAQQLSARLDRSFALPDSDVSGASTEVPTPVANTLVGWNAAGTALENKVPVDVDLTAVTAFAATLLDDASAAAARATLDAQEDVLTTIGDTVEATTAGAATRKAAHATVAAHATTMNPWVARKVTLSGSVVTFTDIADAPYVGASVLLVMNDAHIFTNGAVFDVQGGGDYTATAGDQVLLLATAVDAFDVTVLKADGTAVAGAPYPPKHIGGIVPSIAADTDHDITLSAGSARDSTNAYNLTLAAAITKQIDATWAAGNNAGGMFTGSVANTTWYYMHLIRKDSDGTIDAGFDTSATAANIPSGYTAYKLVAAVLTNGSANIVDFDAYETEGGGLEVLWAVPTLDVNLASTLTTSRRTDVVKVPTSFSVEAHLNVVIYDASAVSVNWVYCPDQTDAAPSGTVAPLSNINGIGSAVQTGLQLRVRTSATGTIAARSTLPTVDLYAVSTLGFKWARRN